MLIFQIKRIISSEKWFNYFATFFFLNAKNLGWLDYAKQRKKKGWPKKMKYFVIIWVSIVHDKTVDNIG